MESGTKFSVVVLFVLVLLSAYFSATETAFTAMNRIRIKNLAAGGDKKSKLVMDLSKDYGRLLSTILVGNNIVNISATSIATVLFVSLYGSLGPTISTVFMTITILIFGEITPKTLANESPETFARFSAPSLKVIMALLRPVNYLFAKWKSFVIHRFKFDKSQAGITEEELMTIVDEAREEGAIEEQDKELIKNVIEFNDSEVSDILTPRVDITAIKVGESNGEITEHFLKTGYSRLPVYSESIDHIIGVIHLRDFFEYSNSSDVNIEDIVTPVVYVAPFSKISEVLKSLQKNKIHMAVAIDEYGGTRGIVTMEDILEELVGEIWDEHDEVVEEILVNRDGSLLVSGNADIKDVFEMLKIEDETKYTTVSGWIMGVVGKIPNQGEEISTKSLNIKILEMDKNRVGKCSIRKIEREDFKEV